MRKFLLYLNLLSLCLVLGCADDESLVRRNDFGSSLEVFDSHKASQFTLSNKLLQIAEEQGSIQIELQSHSSGETITLQGEIREVAEEIIGAFFIPTHTKIEDSDYDVMLRDSEGNAFGARFKISIKGEMFCSVLEEQIIYKGLSGEGTSDEPYLIKTTEQYRSFLSNLLRDSLTHGANLHFRQEETFDAPTDGISDNKGYVPLPFAGHYNGNNKRIEKFFYSGSEDIDLNVGLFSELLDGAYVQNLGIDVSYITNAEHAGAVAGSTKGNVTLSNISAEGSFFNMGHQVGGLVGYASQGKLTIQNSQSYIGIEGTNNIGGLIGKAENDITVVLQNNTVSKMTLNGFMSVGGAIGHLDGSIYASNIVVSRTVDDGKTKVIVADSCYAGGLIGHALLKGEINSIKNVKIETPVEGIHDIGGLIGNLTPTADVKFEGCKVGNTISGKINVGGLIGKVDSNGGTLIFDKSNSVAVADEHEISIKGRTGSFNVGGAIGLSQYSSFKFVAPVHVAINVNGVGSNVGGFFGKFLGNDQSTITISDAWTHDKYMQIDGDNNVGGFVGYAQEITLQDKMNFTLKTSGNQDKLAGVSAFSGTVGSYGITENSGGIVGYANFCTIKNIYVTGTVCGANQTGGIVGQGSCTDFSYCVSDLSTIEFSGSNNGGIAGYLTDSDIDNCVNYSNLSNGKDRTGGIVGYWRSTAPMKISKSVNVGAIDGDKNVGGIVGLIADSYDKNKFINDSANYGSISGAGSGDAGETYGLGGLVGCGFEHIYIQGSVNHGDVSGTDDYHGVGGVAGTLGKSAATSNCENNVQVNTSCNFGKVSGSYECALGGVVGFLEEGCWTDYDLVRVENCYNMGEVASDCDSDTGGVVGLISFYGRLRRSYNVGSVPYGNAILGDKHGDLYHVDDCYFLEGSAAKVWKDKGESRSESEMKNLDTYENFYEDIWQQSGSDVNDGYPHLIHCPFQFVTFSI